MYTTKCHKCGFVSWATADACKRCGEPAFNAQRSVTDQTEAASAPRGRRTRRRAARGGAQHAGPVLVTPPPPKLAGALLILLGGCMLVGEGLATSFGRGFSFYYSFVGACMLLSGALFASGSWEGLRVYLLALAANVLWSFYEVGAGRELLVRTAVPAAIGAFLIYRRTRKEEQDATAQPSAPPSAKPDAADADARPSPDDASDARPQSASATQTPPGGPAEGPSVVAADAHTDAPEQHASHQTPPDDPAPPPGQTHDTAPPPPFGWAPPPPQPPPDAWFDSAAGTAKLTPCPACGAGCSTSAHVCPNCGHQLGIARAVTWALVAAVLFVAFVIFGVYRLSYSAAEARVAAFHGIEITPVVAAPATDKTQTQKPWFSSWLRDKPTVDEVLAQHHKASGGDAGVRPVGTMVAHGKFELTKVQEDTPMQNPWGVAFEGTPLMSGDVKIQFKSPGKILVTLRLANEGGVLQRAFDGVRAWESSDLLVPERASGFRNNYGFRGGAALTRKRNYRELTGLELDEIKSDLNFVKVGSVRDHYTSVVWLGQEKVGPRDAYVLRGLNRRNDFEKLYFDTETGLVTRLDVVRAWGDPATIENYFEDFRAVRGAMIPFRVRQKVGEVRVKMTFEAFVEDVPVDDAVFDKPSH